MRFTGRSKDEIKEAVIQVSDREFKICVVHGLANAEKIIQATQNGEMYYDLIEIMACPEGCIGGAGQPFAISPERDKRAKGLYHTDERVQIKFSDKNPSMQYIYDEIIKNKSHEMLHVHYEK